MGWPVPTRADRINAFWAKVRRGEGCWEWQGGRFWHGYGRIQFMGSQKYAHRLSWELHTGEEIPTDLVVCHHCDNKLCVRPDHLFLGTQTDNMQDARRKGRMRGMFEKSSHCKQGHDLSATRIMVGPNSVCGVCHRARRAKYSTAEYRRTRQESANVSV